MGVDIQIPTKDGRQTACQYKSRRSSLIDFETMPVGFLGKWPEIHIKVSAVEAQDCDHDAPKLPNNAVTVRIHGVSVPELIKAMVKEKALFDYMASAVDYLRANPGKFDQ